MEKYLPIIIGFFSTMFFGYGLWFFTDTEILEIIFWAMSFYMISTFAFQAYLEYLEKKRREKTVIRKPDSILVITLDQKEWDKQD